MNRLRISKIITAVLLTAVCSISALADIEIDNPSSGPGYTWNSPTLTITDGGTYTLTGATTTNRIAVGPGITANITLRDVDINVSGTSNACAFEISYGATVNLTLEGDNVLTSGENKAGLQAPGGTTLVIDGAGSLTATGGSHGAGIGGGGGNGSKGGNGGNIRISGGTVKATGNGSGNGGSDGSGAGIGGGGGGSGSNGGNGGIISISGGTVTATGNGDSSGGGAGIGGGSGGNHPNGYVPYPIYDYDGGHGGSISISGGMVMATGISGAGIGGGGGGNGGIYGEGGNGGSISISGGTVIAQSYNTGIGGGAGGQTGYGGGSAGSGNGGNISISGGTVMAQGGSIGAGIGGGGYGSTVNNGGAGGDITISGGSVTATGGSSYGGSAIGGGVNNESNGNVRIYGGSVKMDNHNGPQPKAEDGTPVYLNTLTLDGLSAITPVTAGVIGGTACSETPSGGSYGIRDVETNTSGNVYFYLPPTTDGPEPVKLVANSKGYGASYPRAGSNTGNDPTLYPLLHDITLSRTDTHPFDDADYGYSSAPAALTVEITNTGTSPTGELSVTPGGSGASAFTPFPASIPDIASGSTAVFTVEPDTELDAGTHTATVTVSGDDGITASFDVSFTVNKATPTLADLDYVDPIPAVTYNGSARSVTVTDGTATGLGAITVYYNGSPAEPTGADTYSVTVNVAGGTNYAPATGLSLGNLVISKAEPQASDLTFSPASVTYNGLPQPLAPADIKASDGITGLGAVTAVYYNGLPTAPVAAGTYKITVDITAGNNYLAATLPIGNYTITGAAPPASAFDLDPTPVTYDGKPHPVTVAVNPGFVGLGAITAIKYGGSTDRPVAAGVYAVTVDIAGGANYAAIADLPIGSFTIAKATPALSALDFTLGDIACTGDPYPVPVIPAKDIEGLGEITVRYNGSTTVPVDPGEYTVTIDIAEGTNYAAVTGLPLGAFIIQEPPIPVPTHFRVLLPSVAGLTTDPTAGTYYVSRGANFTFTLTPEVPSADGTPPQVQTNRPTPDRPNASGIRITPDADGSYTVVIIGIRQDIEIDLAVADSKSGPTDNASVTAGLSISTAPGAIVVTNSRPDAATLYVYSLTGTLVRLTTVPPGTTRLSVPPGIYVVTDGGSFRRKTVVTR
jgi:hypothetical protein